MANNLILWFTGMSGAGKTTVSKGLLPLLDDAGISTKIIDGDEVRKNKNYLGFSREDILKNNEKIIELCLKSITKYRVIMVAIISPFNVSREIARKKLSPGFYEIYFNTSISCLKQRDVKGLYKQETEGKITNLIGISSGSPYECPLNADLEINSENESVEESIEKLFNFIINNL